jgi:HK97 family phage prohead protease
MKAEEIKIEKREVFNPSAVCLREEGADMAGTIEGVAIVTNKETILYECNDYREVEVIASSCLNEEFLREQDIKLNLLHDRDNTIARTPQSLRIDAREDGLHFEADIPDCDLGKRAKALIENGTYTGCSFEFYPKDYEVSERTGADGKTEYLIRHTAFEKITALTIAMDPAYSQTSVKAREIFQAEHPESVPVEEDDREAEEKAAAEEQARLEREYQYRHRQLQMKNL